MTNNYEEYESIYTAMDLADDLMNYRVKVWGVPQCKDMWDHLYTYWEDETLRPDRKELCLICLVEDMLLENDTLNYVDEVYTEILAKARHLSSTKESCAEVFQELCETLDNFVAVED